MTVIMGDLEIEEHLLHDGDSKLGLSVKCSLSFQSNLTLSLIFMGACELT